MVFMRQLRPDDIPHLEKILVATSAFSDEEVIVAVELMEIVVTDQQQQDYVVTVAEAGDRVVGYLLYGPIPMAQGSYDLYWIAVSPSSQGSGIGRELMLEVEEQIRRREGRLLCVETSSQESYRRTRTFYERAGYIEESRICDFYSVGDDRLTYVKRF